MFGISDRMKSQAFWVKVFRFTSMARVQDIIGLHLPEFSPEKAVEEIVLLWMKNAPECVTVRRPAQSG